MKFKIGDKVKLIGGKRNMVVSEEHEDDDLVICMWETSDGYTEQSFEIKTLLKGGE